MQIKYVMEGFTFFLPYSGILPLKIIIGTKAEENCCVFHVLYICGCPNHTHTTCGALIKEETHHGRVEGAYVSEPSQLGFQASSAVLDNLFNVAKLYLFASKVALIIFVLLTP